MKQRRDGHLPAVIDAEVIELLQDDPQLLAIADAVAATQRRKQRRSVRLPSMAAAAALAIVVAVFVLSDRTSLVDDALAAVGSGRVLHTVILRDVAGEQIVNFQTDETRPVTVRVEAWSDPKTARLRVRTFRDGRVVADTLSGAGGATAEQVGLDPTARFFVTGYVTALKSGGATEEGADVLLIEGRQSIARVVLGDSALPVRFTGGETAASPATWWRVLSIRGQALAPDTFDVPAREDHPTGGSVVRKDALAVAEARRALGGAAVWVGRRVAGLALRRIEAHVLQRQLSGGGTARRSGLEISYGGSSGRFVRLRQSLLPDPAYGYVEGRYTFSFAPIPRPGEAVVVAPSAMDQGGAWRGQLRFNDVFLTVLASDRDLLLEAIRALRPIG